MNPISPDDYRRLEPAFDALLDIAPDGREAWLADHDEERPGDRDLLHGLLAAYLAADDRLDEPLPEAATRLVAESLGDPLLDTELGAFRVVEEIGRGGMGVVYLGRRTSGDFDQDVVIKVLRVGVDTDETRTRFLQERSILARLDHPAIVRVLDGGITPDGRPYIVMNRLTGRRIDEYCDQKKLGVEARVRLFLSVIEAVDHAHRHLVIHRDLKPSNVWVDDNGKVHLLDFGIAKILDEDGEGLTLTRHRVMTPEYASPEQYRGGEVTTASDVYQMGILLYQLLTGALPYGEVAETPHEVEKQVCESDPVPASRAVTRSTSTGTPGPDADLVFANRSATPERLRKALSGDLDLILLKALRKEPDRRYNTANGLREDLIRWLSGDRIMARPDSFGYQARRFLRRHPVTVAVVAAAVILSVGFTIFHVNTITEERDLARQEAERRREVSDFLVDLLRVPDPTAAGGREVTARELLEDALPKIQSDLTDSETKMRLLDVVAEVARNLGQFELAWPAHEEIIRLTDERYGSRSHEAAGARSAFAEMLQLNRHFEEALPPAEAALDIRRELFPADHLEVGRSLRQVAMIHRDLRQPEKALEEFEQAMPIFEAHLPPEDRERITLVAAYAYILRTVDRKDESEALYREVIDRMREDPGTYPEDLPAALNNLGYLLRLREDYAEAELLYREAIAIIETHWGESHPRTLMYRNNLAAVLQRLDRGDEAAEQLGGNIPLEAALHGEDHWRVGRSHRSYAICLFQIGRYEESSANFAESRTIFTDALGADHRWTATAAACEALARSRAGDAAAAERLWTGALPVLDTPDARVDGNVQAILKLMRDWMPDDDPWTARLNGLIPAEG